MVPIEVNGAGASFGIVIQLAELVQAYQVERINQPPGYRVGTVVGVRETGRCIFVFAMPLREGKIDDETILAHQRKLEPRAVQIDAAHVYQRLH